jgi:DNA repair exonuclease SbcCD ATPase subunit
VALIRKKTKTKKREHMSVDNTQDAEVSVPSPSEAFNAEVTTSTNPANDDVAKRIQDARAQEKSKLYPQLEKLQEEISILRKEREEANALEAQREAERAAKRAEREAEKKAKLEEEMSVKELLKAKESEWQKQLESERQERERAFALLEREREFQELQQYRSQRLEQERDNIVPALIDLVQGNTKDEIEQSILTLKAKSAQIIDEASAALQGAAQNSRRDMVGARVTAPASGPLDNDSVSNTLGTADLSQMSMADYIKNRDKLLRSGANNRGQGLFGN